MQSISVPTKLSRPTIRKSGTDSSHLTQTLRFYNDLGAGGLEAMGAREPPIFLEL